MIGLYMEEIELGKRVALGQYAFTAENMKAYARQFEPIAFHLDASAGRASIYGAMTAAGLHVACGWMACFVDTNTKARAVLQQAGKILPEIGPSPGFQNMRWLKPVFAGDVLRYYTTATHKRPLASRPGWGIVEGHHVGVNQRGDIVFSFDGAVLTACRLS
jgi:acyl dehydratase